MANKVKDVFVTDDYGIFSRKEGNRQVNRLHVERLKTSIEEEYLVSPITVNESYEIIDGQHRFEAARQLGKPIYYIVCEDYGLDEIHRLNEINQSWTLGDFLEGYSNKGIDSYITAKEFMGNNNINSVQLTLNLLDKDRSQSKLKKMFKDGNFEITSLEWAQNFMDKLEDFKVYFDSWNTSLFTKAFKKLYEHKNYEHSEMVKKLEYLSHNLEKRSTINQYLELLVRIYNHKKRSRKGKIFLDNGDLVSLN